MNTLATAFATPAAEAADDPIYQTDFIKEMLRQTRALDNYGQWDGKTPPEILDSYVLTKERKREIPVIGDPDDQIISRVKAFHNAIAVLIEKECGLMAVPFVQLTHEGFGRALIVVGKLVVMDRTLRDVHRFGFYSLSKMKTEADKYLSVAIELIGKYPDVAGL
jgi:probable nitrogen fixation protein